MSLLLIVLPLAIVMAGFARVAFLTAVRRGQFEDLDNPAVRMLFEAHASAPTQPTSAHAAATAAAPGKTTAELPREANRPAKVASETR